MHVRCMVSRALVHQIPHSESLETLSSQKGIFFSVFDSTSFLESSTAEKPRSFSSCTEVLRQDFFPCTNMQELQHLLDNEQNSF